MSVRRFDVRVLMVASLVTVTLAPGVTGADTIFGKASRVGIVNGSYRCILDPCELKPYRRVRVAWVQTGVLGLGGQIYMGSIKISTLGTVWPRNPVSFDGIFFPVDIKLDSFSFTGTSAGKDIAGSCTGLMTAHTAPAGGLLIGIDLRCTGQITGGEVATGRIGITAVDTTPLVTPARAVACPVIGCSADPDSAMYFQGEYSL